MIKKVRELFSFWDFIRIYYYIKMKLYGNEKEILYSIIFLNKYY